jgi:hypothetical protein
MPRLRALRIGGAHHQGKEVHVLVVAICDVQGASAANASSQQNSLPQLQAQLQEHRAKGMCGDWICAMIMRARALGARPRRVPTDILHAPEAGDAPEAWGVQLRTLDSVDSGRSEPKKKPLESPLAYKNGKGSGIGLHAT